MASSTSAYSFTDDDVSLLANCNDQAEFLHFFQRILQSKSINLTAVFDAQTTLVSSTDYGASVLTRFFETQSHALHLEVGYALFKSCNSSTCLKLDSTPLPTSLRCSHMDAMLRFFLWYCSLLRTEPVCSVGRAFRDIFYLFPWLQPLQPTASQTRRSLTWPIVTTKKSFPITSREFFNQCDSRLNSVAN